MMQGKLFEVRDSMTFIPVLAVRLNPEHANEQESYLLRRSGWRTFPKDETLVLLRADSVEESSRLYASDWYSSRTMRVAHEYIAKHFEEMTPGDVVDVEFILGKTQSPKVSERLTHGDVE